MEKCMRIIVRNINVNCLRGLVTSLMNDGVKSVVIEGGNGDKTVSLFLRAFGFTEIDPANAKGKVESVIIDNNGFHFADTIQGRALAPEITISTPTPAVATIPAQTTVASAANSDDINDMMTELKASIKELRKEVETIKNIAKSTTEPTTIRGDKTETKPEAAKPETTGKKFIFVHCSTDGVSDEDLLLKSLANKAKDPNVVFTAIVGTWAEKVLEKSGFRLRKIYPNFKSFKKSKAFANALNEAWNSASASVFFAKSEAEAKQGKDIAFKAVSKRYNSNAKTTFVVFQDDKKWFLFK